MSNPNIGGATNAQIKNLKEAQALGKALGLEYENIADIQRMILSNQVRTKQELLEQLRLAREAQDIVENEVRLEQEHLNLTEKLNKERRIGRQLNEQIADIDKQISELAKTMFSNTSDTYDQQKKLLAAKKAEIRDQHDAGNISADVARNLTKQVEKQEEILEAVQKIHEEYKGQFEALVALGGFLSKNFGAVGKALEGGINKGMFAFINSMAAGNDKSVAMKDAMKAFGGEMTASITKALGVVGIITLLYDIIKSTTEQAKEFATQTGVTVAQAQQLVVESRNVTQNNKLQLATSKDILAVQQETVSAFGTMAMLTTEQAGNIAELGRAFGYGAQTAAQVNNEFIALGASVDEAYELQQGLAAEALKAGVNVGAVTKDIAQNAKLTSKFFGGNVESLKRSAIEAAKMGVSLATMSKVADRLLDIESSLNAQFEFQAMTGRQINLDKARELALTNHIADATGEVLTEVGSAVEFDNLHFKAKEKLAAAVGMEVDELQKSLIIRERLGDLTDDELAAMSGLNLSAAELTDMDKEDLQNKLAQQQSLDKTNKALEAAKDQISNALLPVAQAFADLLASIAPMLEFIGDLVWVVTWPFVKLVELAKIFGEYLSSFLPKWDELGAMGKGLVGIIKALAIGAVIWGAWAGLGSIPIVGPALAVGAAAAGISLVNNVIQTGDLAMSNDGLIVANPREGTIFQGTKNDEVAMGPGVIDAAQSTGGTTVVQQQSDGNDKGILNALLGKLDDVVSAFQRPTPIQIGTRVITELGNQLNTDKSYRQGYNGQGKD